MPTDGNAADDDHSDLELDDEEDTETVQNSLNNLREKLLDQLAETLARIKADAKHVSATMLLKSDKDAQVRVLCAKIHDPDFVDRDFLHNWKRCLETIAANSKASQKDEDTMFDIVYRHQEPRIG